MAHQYSAAIPPSARLARSRPRPPVQLPGRTRADPMAGQEALVLLVSRSAALLDEVARVCAAAGVRLEHVDTLAEAVHFPETPGAVLIGSDEATEPVPLKRPAVVIGLSGAEGLWHRAAACGIDSVAELPEAAPWLAGYLGRLRDPSGAGTVIGLVGGCGGAGASTLAVLLASWAAAEGIRTFLVDGDEWGGGLDLAVATEPVQGLRWQDLAGASGALSPVQLSAALPVIAGFSLLSWGQAPHADGGKLRSSGMAREVLSAARRGYELTIVDLSRSREAIAALGQHCDRLLLVVPAQLRPVVASVQLLAELPPVPVSAVVRGPLREGLDAEVVASSLGIGLLGYLPMVRGASAAAERGQLPDRASGRWLRTLGLAVLADLTGVA